MTGTLVLTLAGVVHLVIVCAPEVALLAAWLDERRTDWLAR